MLCKCGCVLQGQVSSVLYVVSMMLGGGCRRAEMSSDSGVFKEYRGLPSTLVKLVLQAFSGALDYRLERFCGTYAGSWDQALP